MRSILWMCSLAMLVPSVAAAGAAAGAGPDASTVAEAVIEGSIVGALVMDGDGAPAALEIGGAAATDRRQLASRRAPRRGEPAVRPTRQANRPSQGPSEATTSEAATGARQAGVERSDEIAGARTWQRDVALMMGAGVAGTLLFVAGGRRKRWTA